MLEKSGLNFLFASNLQMLEWTLNAQFGGKKGNLKYSRQAFERALELFDFTIADPKNKGPRLKEILRTRKALIDHFVYDNEYNTTNERWKSFFYQFNYAAALQRGK